MMMIITNSIKFSESSTYAHAISELAVLAEKHQKNHPCRGKHHGVDFADLAAGWPRASSGPLQLAGAFKWLLQ